MQRLIIESIYEANKKALYIVLDLNQRGKQQKNQEDNRKTKGKPYCIHNKKQKISNRHCRHYDIDGHMNEKCSKFHLDLCPKWHKFVREIMITPKTKETKVEGTFHVHETMVCTTLRQLRESGDINALLQIEVHDKNHKANAFVS